HLRPNVAYSSSLIQQDHGESLRDHGLIKWDLTDPSDIKPTFVPIHNDYGLVTVNLTGDQAIMPEYLPLKSTLKFRMDRDLTDTEKQIVLDQFQKLTDVISYSYERASNGISIGDISEEQAKHMSDVEIITQICQE